MDMAFLRRAERLLDQSEPHALDHQLLLAVLAARQNAAVKARACAATRVAAPGPGDEESLVEVLLAGPRWREAARRQSGCFSRAEAGRRVNAP